jgi:hypothetical protein
MIISVKGSLPKEERIGKEEVKRIWNTDTDPYPMCRRSLHHGSHGGALFFVLCVCVRKLILLFVGLNRQKKENPQQ